MFETTHRHLYLAGFMGTGKSVIGREIAKQLSWGFIDLDEFIVSLCHRTIPDIFRLEGETAFRNYEARALRLAVISPHSVISLGGGTPMRRDNENIIHATGRSWHLTARMDVIWHRVRHEAASRPMLTGIIRNSDADGPGFDDFRNAADPLLQKRRQAYTRITGHMLDTSDGSIDGLAMRIVEEFRAILTRGGVE